MNDRAEDNVDLYRVRKLKRTIETYLANVRSGKELEWQLDVFVVVLNKEDLEVHRLERMENMVLGRGVIICRDSILTRSVQVSDILERIF